MIEKFFYLTIRHMKIVYVLFIATLTCVFRAFESFLILIKCFTQMRFYCMQDERKNVKKNVVVSLASDDRHPGNYFSYYHRRCIFILQQCGRKLRLVKYFCVQIFHYRNCSSLRWLIEYSYYKMHLQLSDCINLKAALSLLNTFTLAAIFSLLYNSS